MVLKNLQAYETSICKVTAMLKKEGVDVSFSNATWNDVAGLVGLNPQKRLRDVETFPVYRATLPQSTHDQIIQGVYRAALQYGTPIEYQTEKATMWFLIPIFDNIVALFDSHIRNKPGYLLNDRVATRDQIQYLYSAFGKILLVFKVKVCVRGGIEIFNAIAQVICEADGML